MASDVFDLFLQIGKPEDKDPRIMLPSLKELHLKNIPFRKHIKQINNTYIQVYSSDSATSVCFESANYAIVKIGRCYSTNAFSTESSYSKELSVEDLATIYHEKKTSITNVIKGVFVLVVYIKQTDCVFALSSKSGLLKLYYYVSNDTLLLSTTIDTIARHPFCKTELNTVALIEQLKFGYPLGNMTLLSGISILDNHSWLYFNNNETNLSITKYYSLADKLNEFERLSWAETFEQTPGMFNLIMDKFLAGNETINTALTSGFDSRTVLSASLHHKDRIQYFSYGATSKSEDVRIPLGISKKLGLNYKWIEFTPNFFSDYDFYADQLLYFTDGNGNLKRCNQMYSQSVLSWYSGLCITGCMGSELLRPNNMMSTNILPDMAKLVYQDRLDADSIADVMAVCPDLLQQDKYSRFREDAIEHVYDHLKSVMQFRKAYLNLYHFTIRYSLWKFFGQEFHASRIYSDLLSPFIDDDFVELILKTPIPSLNKNAFKRNAADLKKGQLFYTPILKKNFPELMKMETGRGYSPLQLESFFYPLNIIIPYLMRRMKNTVINKKAAFDSSEWNNISYKAHPEVFTKSNDYFRELNIAKVKDAEYSLKKWAMDYL
jgi:hypothetical protein